MSISVVDGFRVTNNAPIDDRDIFDTLANAKAGIASFRRTEGLRTYITTEKKTYRFIGGILDANLVPDPANMCIDVTYSSLATIIGASGLNPGQSYKITDFQTIHAIPAQAGLQLTGTIPINTGAVDPIVVKALTTNKLEPIAFQPSQPNDILNYDVTDAFCEDTTTPRPGAISYRWDTFQNVSAYYDWKVCKFRRYKLDQTLYTAWSVATAYVRDNLVLQSDALWCCNVAHTNQTPSDSNNYWTKVLDFVSTLYHLYKKSIVLTGRFTLTADAAAFKDCYTFHNNTGDVLLSSVRNVHIGCLSKDLFGSAVRSYNNIVLQHPNSSSLCGDSTFGTDCCDMNFICTTATNSNSFLGNVFEPLITDFIGRNMNGNHFWARASFFIVGILSSRIIGSGIRIVIGNNANTITMQYSNNTNFVGGGATNLNITGQLVACTVGGGIARMFAERPVGAIHLLGSMGTGTHIGCHNGTYILTQANSKLSSTDSTIDIKFLMTFDGTAGKGQVGSFTLLDSFAIPNTYRLIDLVINPSGLSGVGAIINLGWTGSSQTMIDDTDGNIASGWSSPRRITPALSISNSDTNVLIAEVKTADITSGAVTISARFART